MFLYAVKMHGFDEKIINKLMPNLSIDLQKKVSHYLKAIDKQRAIFTDLLVRYVLSKELGSNMNSVKFEINPYGKPYLKEHEREFNLSHSENMIILATDDTAIGVDVECIKPIGEIDDLINNFFSEQEKIDFSSKKNEEKLNYFYELWTLKESYIKALGEGLSHTLSSFSIKTNDKGSILLQAGDTHLPWYFKNYILADNYMCAVCSRHPNFPENIIFVSVSELVDYL